MFIMERLTKSFADARLDTKTGTGLKTSDETDGATCSEFEHTDINEKDTYGLTPLHLATSSGKVERMEELLKRGADPNAENRMGMTPLHLVGRFPNTEMAALLIQHGARVNHKTLYGTTPMQSAAIQGNADLIRLLSRNGADPAVQDDDGATALDLARDEDTKQLLLKEITHAKGERCELCGISEFQPDVSLKRCGNCKTVFYCSKICQKKDWKERHKDKCLEFAIGYPNFEPFGRDKGVMYLTSHQDWSVRKITQSEVRSIIGQLGTERFLVKVQVPFTNNDPALTVYNEDRSIFVTVQNDAPGYLELRTRVINEGCPVKIKAFFWAQANGNGGIKIYHGKLGPFKSW